MLPKKRYSTCFQKGKILDISRLDPLNRAMLTDLDKRIIAAVQGDISITKRPYLEIAEQLGRRAP